MQLRSSLGSFLNVSVISGHAEVQMAEATFELKERSSVCSLCTEKMPGCPCFPNAVSVGEPPKLQRGSKILCEFGSSKLFCNQLVLQ